jgi:hypothetical protein
MAQRPPKISLPKLTSPKRIQKHPDRKSKALDSSINVPFRISCQLTSQRSFLREPFWAYSLLPFEVSARFLPLTLDRHFVLHDVNVSKCDVLGVLSFC